MNYKIEVQFLNGKTLVYEAIQFTINFGCLQILAEKSPHDRWSKSLIIPLTSIMASRIEMLNPHNEKTQSVDIEGFGFV